MTEVYDWEWQDTTHLLAYIYGYTMREAGHAEQLAWTDAARTGRWTPDLARRAVTTHYLEQPDVWIKPGHVHQRVRSWREDALMRAEVRPPLEDGTVSRRPVKALMSRLTDRWVIPSEDPDEPVTDELASIAVPCPFEGCRAPVGEPCTVGVAGARRQVRTHPSRHVALADAAGQAGLNPRVDCDVECPVCAAPPNVRCVNLSTGGYLSFRLGTHYKRMVALHDDVQEGTRGDEGAPSEEEQVRSRAEWVSRHGRD